VHPVDPDLDVVPVSEVAFHERPVLVLGDLTSRVITEDESPAADPKKPSSAGAKSPVESPCR
jgi:hypothetical protein